MARYLLLKHYRGAPAPVNDVPMEQWTPCVRDARGFFGHCGYRSVGQPL
jgi:hypothetical protein